MAGEPVTPAEASPPAPAPKKNVLARRVIFGSVLLAISCGLLALDWKTGRSFGLASMVAFAMVFGLRELYRMLGAIAPIIWPGFGYLAGFLIVAADVAKVEAPARIASRMPSSAMVIAVYFLVIFGFQLRGTPSRERLASICVTCFGALYIMFLGSFVMKCRYLTLYLPPEAEAPNIGYAAVLYLILAAKGTDMFAFFSGRFLGKRKLIPLVSPGKTFAGAVGGLAGAALITVLFSLYSDLGRVFGWTTAIPFGILIGLSAQAGDLVESLIKRGTAVKDSGGLVPEFGGVLDIIDSILYVAPVIVLGAVLLV